MCERRLSFRVKAWAWRQCPEVKEARSQAQRIQVRETKRGYVGLEKRRLGETESRQFYQSLWSCLRVRQRASSHFRRDAPWSGSHPFSMQVGVSLGLCVCSWRGTQHHDVLAPSEGRYEACWQVALSCWQKEITVKVEKWKFQGWLFKVLWKKRTESRRTLCSHHDPVCGQRPAGCPQNNKLVLRWLRQHCLRRRSAESYYLRMSELEGPGGHRSFFLMHGALSSNTILLRSPTLDMGISKAVLFYFFAV